MNFLHADMKEFFMAHCVYLQLVRTGTFKKLEFTSEKINILQTEKFKLQSKGAYSFKKKNLSYIYSGKSLEIDEYLDHKLLEHEQSA